MRCCVRWMIVLTVAAAGPAVRAAADAQSTRFDADVVATRLSDTTARVDVYVVIPYQQLSFVRDGALYNARYEVMVQLRTTGDSLTKEKTYLESLQESNYDVTIGKTGKFVFHQKTLASVTGDYTVTITVTDDNARRTHSEVRSLHIPDYAHVSVGLSSLLMASAIADMAGQRSITPHIGLDVSDLRQGVFAFFETYAKKRDALDAVYLCINAQGREVLRSKRLPIVVDSGTVRHFLKVQTQLLSQGTYVMKLGVFPHVADTAADADFGNALATMSHPLTVEWGTGVPQTEDDIDRAVAQLRWVATSDDMDKIRSAPTLEAKRDAYKRFWDDRDPSPGTLRNEAFELYMARIRYANEHFKGYAGEGYASDQGMIYVIFGEPSSIEPHPYEYITYGIYHGPYTVWYYQRYNRNYVFIDQDGFGDYRLASPLPIERFRYGQ